MHTRGSANSQGFRGVLVAVDAAAIVYALLFLAGLTSCNAVRSITGAVIRNTAGLFSSPEKVSDKITSPVCDDARMAALWVGHATVLLQLEDRFILTDPNLTPTVGMFGKRLIEPGIDPKNLPPLDAVLISHMHMDHLSYGSLDLIEAKIRHLLVPEGGLVYIPDYDFPMLELPTWRQWEHAGLRITAVPVRHTGWRYGLDDAWMKKSATGYVIEYRGMTVYFAGDTGYDAEIFWKTGRRFPRIDIAFLPVSPINPRDFTQGRHADPHDALRIFRDLGARTMVPIHFDTYHEGVDSLGEAPATLRAIMAREHLSSDEISLMRIGEQRVFIRIPREGQ